MTDCGRRSGGSRQDGLVGAEEKTADRTEAQRPNKSQAIVPVTERCRTKHPPKNNAFPFPSVT